MNTHRLTTSAFFFALLAVACGEVIAPNQNAVSAAGSGGGTASTSSATGSGGSGGTGGCSPTLHGKVLPGKDLVVSEGAASVLGTIKTEFTVKCGQVGLNFLQYQFLALNAPLNDFSPFCAGPCKGDNGNFINIRLVDGQGFHFTKLAGLGLTQKDPETAPAVADVSVKIPFVIFEGVPQQVLVEFDVAVPLASPAAHGKHFRIVPLQVGTDPPGALVEYTGLDSLPSFMVQ